MRKEFLEKRKKNIETELKRIQNNLDNASMAGQPVFNITKLQARLEATKENLDKINKELGHG